MRLGEANPGTVDIYKLPKDNFGVLYCAIPKEWVFIRVPKKMNLTEEQKQERAERMRGIRSVTDDSTVLEEAG